MNLTKDFTFEQRAAISAKNKNIKIVACAGSGKTRTIVGRIIYLLTIGTKPNEIVAITYTEKAAASLKQKIYEQFERKFNTLEGLGDLFVGTIHGFCLHLLLEHNDNYKSFDILNEVQVKLFIKQNRDINGFNECQFFSKSNKSMEPLSKRNLREDLSKKVTAYKNALDIIREYGLDKIKDQDSKIRLGSYINNYEKTLRDNKFLDFTSIIVETLNLVKKGEFDDYFSTLKFLIVDEYQDVNESQEEVIQYMSKMGVGICVVGDDDQTIYNWRGSRFKFFKDFEKRYPDVYVQELSKNFRSSIGITKNAEFVISKNKNRIPKKMISNETQKYEKGDIIVKEFDSREDEINFIINKIKQLQRTEYVKGGKNMD